jgi:pyruvate-formate lyase-activating enzyme
MKRSLRCRRAFEELCIHANGDVVCSIIDGRGDFVLGSVYRESLSAIFHGERARELRQWVLSAVDSYCPGIGKNCPLKRTVLDEGEPLAIGIRGLAIELTTACDARCLACPVRDFDNHVTWRQAFADGGLAFFLWDAARRSKQHGADVVSRVFPSWRISSRHWPLAALLLRGRIPASRLGALPLEVAQRIIREAGPAVERIELFGYGEPFLYPQVVEVLRCIRDAMPAASISVSTNGLHVSPAVEDTIARERLIDYWIFSIDGTSAAMYGRYRIGGHFSLAWSNLLRAHRRCADAGIHVVWQYVVFRWNDRDEHLLGAILKANEAGVRLWFDFARTFGRSRRNAEDIGFLQPYLRPFCQTPE